MWIYFINLPRISSNIRRRTKWPKIQILNYSGLKIVAWGAAWHCLLLFFSFLEFWIPFLSFAYITHSTDFNSVYNFQGLNFFLSMLKVDQLADKSKDTEYKANYQRQYQTYEISHIQFNWAHIEIHIHGCLYLLLLLAIHISGSNFPLPENIQTGWVHSHNHIIQFGQQGPQAWHEGEAILKINIVNHELEAFKGLIREKVNVAKMTLGNKNKIQMRNWVWLIATAIRLFLRTCDFCNTTRGGIFYLVIFCNVMWQD